MDRVLLVGLLGPRCVALCLVLLLSACAGTGPFHLYRAQDGRTVVSHVELEGQPAVQAHGLEPLDWDEFARESRFVYVWSPDALGQALVSTEQELLHSPGACPFEGEPGRGWQRGVQAIAASRPPAAAATRASWTARGLGEAGAALRPGPRPSAPDESGRWTSEQQASIERFRTELLAIEDPIVLQLMRQQYAAALTLRDMPTDRRALTERYVTWIDTRLAELRGP